MNSEDLTKEQAWKINRGLTRVQVYLFRLGRRMEHVGFPRDDPLYKLVNAAIEGLRPLVAHVIGTRLGVRCDSAG
jgi:hypothetical protein